jgi:glutamate dehydrogenase/leucine dehydrogenase
MRWGQLGRKRFRMSRLFEASPHHLAERMLEAGQTRAYLAFDSRAKTLNVSHPMFQELADWLLTEAADFREHEAVFLALGPETRSLFAAFVHRTVRGQAQGGLRHWPYESMDQLLSDGLRLSAGMTRKNALAGLWWGGGKGIIAGEADVRDRDPEWRRRLYREYGSFISSLRGCYLTAEDVGTNPSDVAEVHRTTRFVTCIPPEFGGAGNPSAMTAAGVVCAIEAAIDFLKLGSLAGMKIALQGAGHVGSSIVPLLLERGVREIIASDVCGDRCAALMDRCAGHPVEVRQAARGGIGLLAEPCDVLVPSALGGILDSKTIPHIGARIVCGPSNNQLADEERDGRALEERGILHVPDFVGNRMGIVYCGNEQYGYVNGDPMVKRHLDRDWPGGIYQTTLRVLELASGSGVTPIVAARRLADELAEQPHPIWGHRARKIIESLIADRWERA